MDTVTMRVYQMIQRMEKCYPQAVNVYNKVHLMRQLGYIRRTTHDSKHGWFGSDWKQHRMQTVIGRVKGLTVMGFSGNGVYAICYACIGDEDTVGRRQFIYSLHVFKVHPTEKWCHVYCGPLFDSEPMEWPLFITYSELSSSVSLVFASSSRKKMKDIRMGTLFVNKSGSACWEKRIALSAAHALQPPVLPFKPNVQHLGEVTVLVTGNFVVGAMIEQPLHDNEYSLVQPCSDQARFSWLHQFVTTVRFEPSLETMQSSCLCHRSCPCALPPWTISRTSESMDPALQPNQPRSRPIYILQTAFDVEVFLQVSLQRLFNSQDLDLGVILDYETSIIDTNIHSTKVRISIHWVVSARACGTPLLPSEISDRYKGVHLVEWQLLERQFRVSASTPVKTKASKVDLQAKAKFVNQHFRKPQLNRHIVPRVLTNTRTIMSRSAHVLANPVLPILLVP
eukprot:m.290647 g.290647  ORF g.290647 m.290647 type:complete len:452 (-) comp15816_c0_seq42:3475-4830(-)